MAVKSLHELGMELVIFRHFRMFLSYLGLSKDTFRRSKTRKELSGFVLLELQMPLILLNLWNDRNAFGSDTQVEGIEISALLMKKITIEGSYKKQNDKVYAHSSKETAQGNGKGKRDHHATSVIVWWGVSHQVVTKLLFCY